MPLYRDELNEDFPLSYCIASRGRLMRRTIARYLVVALIQTLRCIDVKVKKRFPSLTHLSEAGIITEQERKIIQDLDAKCIQVRPDRYLGQPARQTICKM